MSVVDEYVEWLNSWGASARTVSARRAVATGRLDEWGVEGLTPYNIQGWLARPGLSKWTRATYHAHLKSFCDWLTAAGHLEDNPASTGQAPVPFRGASTSCQIAGGAISCCRPISAHP